MTRVVITQPDEDGAPHIHEVHLLPDDGRHAFAGFNVTELDKGRLLRVSAFMARDGSEPPGVHWFRDFAAEQFPRGEIVAGTRMGEDGILRAWSRRYRSEPLPVSAEPRVLLTEPEVWRWAALFIGVLLFIGIATWGAIEAATIWADRAERAWAGHSFTNGGGR